MADPRPAVLLDLDGTLIDSRPGIELSLRAALAEMGHAPEPDLDLTWAIGPPIADVMARLLTGFGDDRLEEGAATYRRHYGAAGMFHADPYPGIPAALDALRADGAALYLATSKRTVFAMPILERLGLADRFTAIHGSEPGGAVDHKPELIAHILSLHGLQAAGTVMAGDRRYDISGAHANGVRAVGVLWGYGDRAELEEAGADGLAAAPQDLPAAVRAQRAG
ncbi:HAD hydrolase-like protein [Muricoccus radiodurans]|uniref:HAD hydrolase-like protein n=1 Tax=Muricoccus radiodurans TaxID=2231721 RepID=UPI003CE6F93B